MKNFTATAKMILKSQSGNTYSHTIDYVTTAPNAHIADWKTANHIENAMASLNMRIMGELKITVKEV